MKKLLILSGKGGTGKTTVAAAFIDFLNANAFADCDVDAPNLHIVAGFTTIPEYKDYYGAQKAVINYEKCDSCGICLEKCRFGAITLNSGQHKINEYACEGCSVCHFVCPQNAITMIDDIAGEQMLYRTNRVFSTAKLKMGRGNSGKLVTEVKTTLTNNAQNAKLAIIDGSPGIGCPVIASVTGVDLVLIVAEPSLSGMHDMERILKTTAILGASASVCVNKYDTCMEHTETIENYCRDNRIPFLGRIPYDKQASITINAGHSLAAVDCPASAAIKAVLEKTLEILDLQKAE